MVNSADIPVEIQPYLQRLQNKYQQWWKLYKLFDEESERFDFRVEVQTEESVQKDHPAQCTSEKKTISFPALGGIARYIAKEPVLLVGQPGSGKSTALVRFLLKAVEQARQNPQAPIPVLIELRRCNTQARVLTLIQDTLERLGLEEVDIKKLRFAGRPLLLLLDGLNELPSRQALTDVRNFREDCADLGIPMVVTTRGLDGDNLGIERQLEIKALTPSEIQRFLQTCLPQKSKQRLQELSDRLRELGRTPLMLWMLYVVLKEQQGEIPNSRGELFRRFLRIYEHKREEKIYLDDETQRWWTRLLKPLAYEMMRSGKSGEPTDFRLEILKQDAETICKDFLKAQAVNNYSDLAIRCLDALIKHHLIQLDPEKQEIEFCHQLLQEYYAAEWLLDRLPELSDEQLKYYFLNYLKWTEAIGLMLGLPEVTKEQALAIVELALNEVDLMLGAKLAGEVKPQLQVQSVDLIRKQQIPALVKVHLLGATRSKYAISDLVHALLQHENLTLSTDAAIMLWHLGEPALVDELLNLLDHNNYIVRANAAFAALGLRGIDNDRIISRLAEALQDENEHEYFRESAARTLSALGNPKAIPALTSALQDSSMHVREKAVEGLGDLSDQTAFDPLFKIALEDQSPIVRWSAAHALGKIDAKAAMQSLLEVIENENYKMRERAAEAIEHLESEEVIPTLVELLENYKQYRYSYIYSKAAKGLERIGTETAIQGLIQALKNLDFKVCRAAINALGHSGNQTVIPKLTEMLEDPNPDVREEVAFALGNLGSKAAIPELIKFSVDKQNRMVPGRTGVAAARLLGNLGDKVAIPALLKTVKDPKKFPNSRACGVVLGALGKLGCEEIIPELFKRLEEDKSWVKSEVIDGLASLNDQVIRSRLCELLEHSDRELRIAAAKVLSKLSDATTIEHLRKALEDSDLEVRLYVMDALEALCDFVSLPRLWQMQLVEETNSSFLSVIKAIQTGDRCQFYNYAIAQSDPPPPAVQPASSEDILSVLTKIKEVLEAMSESKYNVQTEVFQVIENNYGEVTAKKYASDPAMVEALAEITQILQKLQESPSAETQIEEILDAEFKEVERKDPEKWKRWMTWLSIVFAGGIEAVKAVNPWAGIPIEMVRKLYEVYEKNRQKLPGER
jgi:HEAT repeat protein/Cdc6-like AAA superfamily ATPase